MKVCIFSAQSVGGTFLDWSIHFLSGKTHYYSSQLKQHIPLTLNPIASKNAHNHLKNHPDGAELTKLNLEQCDTSTGLYSVYTHPIHLRKIAAKNNIKFSKENFSSILKHRDADTSNLFSVCNQYSSKLIHLAGESHIPLYLSTSNRNNFSIVSGKVQSSDELTDQHDQFFFYNSIDQWSSNNLTNIWDIREQRALNARPLRAIREYQIPYPHLRIDCRELWHNGVDVINRIMSYLELPIDQQRLSIWKKIYSKWAKVHHQPLSFNYNCQHIVNATINNWNYAIDLTFDQEVIIQHFLIYAHNLNLKTWQLTKFPSNTQDLHKLLETNIHQVPHIYQDVLTHIY